MEENCDPAHLRQLRETNGCPEGQLSGVDLRGAELNGANLVGADLSYANLNRADLSYADLRGINLVGAKMG